MRPRVPEAGGGAENAHASAPCAQGTLLFSDAAVAAIEGARAAAEESGDTSKTGALDVDELKVALRVALHFELSHSDCATRYPKGGRAGHLCLVAHMVRLTSQGAPKAHSS